MISASATYLAGLRHSHESIIQVTAYEGSTLVGDLAVNKITLTLDSTSDVQRSADIEVGIDPLQTQARDTLESLTTSKGKVVIKHGIGYGGQLVGSMVTLATLRIDSMVWGLSKATRTLRCFDRSLLLQEYKLPTARPLNNTYVNLIETLITETLPNDTLTIAAGINTTASPAPGKSFNRGDDRLRKIQELAEAIDAWLVCEPDGTFTLTHAPGSTTAQAQAVQWTFDQGTDGVLIGADSTFSRRDQYNAVGIEFVPAVEDVDWSGYIFMWDNDVNSPTYFDGDFGKRPIFFTDEYDHLPSLRFAEAVARRKLYEHSGQTRAIRVTSVYNPLLLPGDKIEVELPDETGGFTAETHFIDRLNIEFGTSAAMDVDTRLARLPGSVGISVDGAITVFGWSDLALTGTATGENLTARAAITLTGTATGAVA